jgi:hypothetical protein
MTTNPFLTSERAALRTAIGERDAAKEQAGVASETADRSAEQVRSAEKMLACFGDVNDAILKHRAASFKSAAQGGAKPSLALPADLVRRERARDEAASAVAAAKAAHASLASELTAAKSALRKAELKVSETAGEVLVAKAAEQGRILTDVWTDLWAKIDALNALRASLHIRLPPEIIHTLQSFEAMDHRQFPGGRNERLGKAIQHWRTYHSDLCKSADATQSDHPINDGESSAVIERVA